MHKYDIFQRILTNINLKVYVHVDINIQMGAYAKRKKNQFPYIDPICVFPYINFKIFLIQERQSDPFNNQIINFFTKK